MGLEAENDSQNTSSSRCFCFHPSLQIGYLDRGAKLCLMCFELKTLWFQVSVGHRAVCRRQQPGVGRSDVDDGSSGRLRRVGLHPGRATGLRLLLRGARLGERDLPRRHRHRAAGRDDDDAPPLLPGRRHKHPVFPLQSALYHPPWLFCAARFVIFRVTLRVHLWFWKLFSCQFCGSNILLSLGRAFWTPNTLHICLGWRMHFGRGRGHSFLWF